MQTIIELSEDQLQVLDRVSKERRISSDELVRCALDSYLEPHKTPESRKAFGLWKCRAEDGLAYQERLRGEW